MEHFVDITKTHSIKAAQVVLLLSTGKYYTKDSEGPKDIPDFSQEEFLRLFKELNKITDTNVKTLEDAKPKATNFVWLPGCSENMVVNKKEVIMVQRPESKPQGQAVVTFTIKVTNQNLTRDISCSPSQALKYFNGDFTTESPPALPPPPPTIPDEFDTQTVRVLFPVNLTYQLFNIPNPTEELKAALNKQDISKLKVSFDNVEIAYKEKDSEHHVWEAKRKYHWSKDKECCHQIDLHGMKYEIKNKGNNLKDKKIEASNNAVFVQYLMD